MYNIVTAKQLVSKEGKEYLASCLENIVEEYRQDIDKVLRCYDATDQEAQLELNKEAHEFRHGEEERNVL